LRISRQLAPVILIIVCLLLPTEADAVTGTPFLLIAPAVDIPPFAWTRSDAASNPPEAPASPDPDESPQNALISKTSSYAPSDSQSGDNAVWDRYIDRFIVPNLHMALAERLAEPLPGPARQTDTPAKLSDPDHDPPVTTGMERNEPFIEIVIPMESAPGSQAKPPVDMHVQVLLPRKTITTILLEAASSPVASEPALKITPRRILFSREFQVYLHDVTETLKGQATAQQHFRTANLTGSILGGASNIIRILALGTLPLHAVITIIPMALWYAISAALGQDPQDLQWKLFSNTSNSLLSTTFSETLIPVP
jgi:hypothetical protein